MLSHNPIRPKYENKGHHDRIAHFKSGDYNSTKPFGLGYGPVQKAPCNDR